MIYLVKDEIISIIMKSTKVELIVGIIKFKWINWKNEITYNYDKWKIV